MRIIDLARNSFSIFPLMRKIKTLDRSVSPSELVAIALDCPAIQPQQTHYEFVGLASLVQQQQCDFILEIGTFQGGSLFVFSQLATATATVISLDYYFTFLGKVCRLIQRPFLRTFVRPGQTLILVRNDSHKPGTLATIKEKLHGNKLDFLFIDGDHSYEGVKKDFDMYSTLVRIGGMVAFHDIARDTESFKVHKFWNEIKGNYVHKEFIHKADIDALGIGVLWI